MLPILEILLPVFGLILAGFVAGRRGLLGPHAATELNRYVVWLALPALLFDAMATTAWGAPGQAGFVGTIILAYAGIYVLVLVVQRLKGRPLSEASIDAMSASYPNTGYIGIPLCLLAFGPASLMPTSISTVLVACELFVIASVLLEVSQHTERSGFKLGIKVVKALARNPLIVSPFAGGLVAAAGVPLHSSLEVFLKLLSGSASPCALVSLGLFLAARRPAADAPPRDALVLTGFKLLIQPALAWWLAAKVFALPAELVGISLVIAALPTGTGPFMLAEFYRCGAQVASRTILLSTIVSVATLSLLLLALNV